MRTLATAQEEKIILNISKLVAEKKIDTTEAWKLFSRAKQTDTLAAADFILSEDDIANLKTLKSKTVAYLKRKSKNRCAHCRRQMGTHAMSWHIEHIRPKAKFPNTMFSIKNLVYACLDCNFTKNSNIDNKNNYIFDIINPGESDFSYYEHLSYYQLTTDNFHIIKYIPISTPGQNTYKKLNLYKIEALEAVTGLNSDIRDIAHRIDAAVEKLEKNSQSKDLAEFLTHLKLELSVTNK